MKAKRKKSRFKVIKIHKLHLKHKVFAFFIIILFFIILYIKHLLIPVVVENTKKQIQTFATKSINIAVAETMNQNFSYGELINVVKDNSNNVSYIEANSVRINLLSKSMSKVVMSNFLELAKRPIKISLGSFSGISILAGYGPKIAYQVNPYGEVFCFFSNLFCLSSNSSALYMASSRVSDKSCKYASGNDVLNVSSTSYCSWTLVPPPSI
jgi:sporulation protein YunB